MSISHYSAESRVQLGEEQQQEEEAATWLHTPRLNLNKNCASGSREEEKEAMFEKPLTPSDVGKLNRLVIPKQHAEKHFPLDSSRDTAKGLLLSFEDESGKCWRFRYSYWNSSQSYVLTKGWSRYVKDKLLQAGDVVLFHRHRTHPQRFFISCTRRQTTTSSCYSAQPQLPFQYHPHSLHAPGGGSQGQNSSSGRVLRLFGVNMECQPDHDSQNSTPQSSYTLSPTLLYNHQPSYSSPNPQPHPHMLRQLP